MIFIGYSNEEKKREIEKYKRENYIDKVYVITNNEIIDINAEHINFPDVIKYVVFYRLLQEIKRNDLIVINECLRTQNRYDLSYNCMRNYLNMTGHQLIFQQYPIIDDKEDFMILFDFDTQSRWRKNKFDIGLIKKESTVTIKYTSMEFNKINIATSKETKKVYEKKREKLFAEIGSKDPHTIPRNLHLLSTKDKVTFIRDNNDLWYVARNQRIKDNKVVTYSKAEQGNYHIVDFPHRFIDFLDFLYAAKQTEINVLVSELKVDEWYFQRYEQWLERLNDTISSLY